ncbi:hypothetical protein ACTGXE_04705 [Streptococcus suis]
MVKIEKIFVLVFFGCLLLSSITFLAYDYVSEEVKQWITGIGQ